MLLYHGCASYDQIAKQGLIFDRGRSNVFGEGEYLASCGGIYLTDSIEVAAFYANNAMSNDGWTGGDPCVFAVEIDPDLLIADEDKVWDALRAIIERETGRRMKDDLELDEAVTAADEFVEHSWYRVVKEIQRKFMLPGMTTEEEDVVRDAARAFLIRATCYEWSVNGGFEAELEAIDGFCALARRTVSRSWLSEHYEDFSLSCRTMEPILPMSDDAGPRIVGSIRLEMGELGLAVEGIVVEGVMDEEDALDFQDAFLEKVAEQGVEIEGFDLRTGRKVAIA